MDNNAYISFKQALQTHIVINRSHVTRVDWGWIAKGPHPFDNHSAWKKVAKEEPEYYEELIREGCSFSYASILQQCSRNHIDWILFDASAPYIRGLKVYEDEWEEDKKATTT